MRGSLLAVVFAGLLPASLSLLRPHVVTKGRDALPAAMLTRSVTVGESEAASVETPEWYTDGAAAADNEMAKGGGVPTWETKDFVGTEWKIAILWEDKTEPQETWIRFLNDVRLHPLDADSTPSASPVVTLLRSSRWSGGSTPKAPTTSRAATSASRATSPLVGTASASLDASSIVWRTRFVVQPSRRACPSSLTCVPPGVH